MFSYHRGGQTIARRLHATHKPTSSICAVINLIRGA